MVDDADRVARLLGRPPRSSFEVVVRAPDGDPVVICNPPLLDDGTPMPTRWWLVGHHEREAVSRLEAGGGVKSAAAAVDPEELAAAHARYAAARDAADKAATEQQKFVNSYQADAATFESRLSRAMSSALRPNS